MNANNFTTKALEALSHAQQNAFDNSSPQLDTIHLLKGMLEVDEDALPFILEKAGANKNILLRFCYKKGVWFNVVDKIGAHFMGINFYKV